jgi:hypothetical protein
MEAIAEMRLRMQYQGINPLTLEPKTPPKQYQSNPQKKPYISSNNQNNAIPDYYNTRP